MRVGAVPRGVMTRYARAVGALTMVALAPSVVPEVRAAEPPPARVVVTVDAGSDLGATNPKLLGVGWNTGTLDGVAPLVPPTVRIDADLHQASRGPGQLDLGPLLGKVAAVRAIGAEPLVILSYMPTWLAQHFGGFDGRDPTRVRPRDFDAWQALIGQVVEPLATSPSPARRFEVWNEPDLPVFWQDLPDAFFELARRTHAAVAAVEADTGLDLEVGGPATAFPDPAFIVPYAHDNDPDFVSWHFYGNHPLLGPDGNEGFIPDEAYRAIAHRNPVTSPREFSAQVEMVRSWVAPGTKLAIDEWNVAAGGFDLRHDTSEGGAFDAGALMEMEKAGLDGADFYRAMNGPGDRAGDWGLTRTDGSPKPAWWVFRAFGDTAGTRLHASAPADPDLFMRATRRGPTIHVLLSNFSAEGGHDQAVRVTATGAACGPRATVRVMTGPDGDLATGTGAPVVAGRVDVDLPAQSVAWVSLRACR